jgi:hypothetical protein
MAARPTPRISSLSAAFALVALYTLTLLLPLHQAAGLQRDLEQYGYARLDTWSICSSIAQDKSGKEPTALKCPASGIAKHELAAVLPTPPSFVSPTTSVAVDYAYRAPRLASRPFAHFGQARAPPVLV